MASAPSMRVSVESVSLCKLYKREGNGSGRYECSVLSCAWKEPRALTGLLASAPFPQCSLNLQEGHGRRRRSSSRSVNPPAAWRCENLIYRNLDYRGTADLVLSGRFIRSCIIFFSDKTWKLSYSSSSLEPSDAISPESLWEDLKPTISYLAPEELKLVYDALKLPYEKSDYVSSARVCSSQWSKTAKWRTLYCPSSCSCSDSWRT